MPMRMSIHEAGNGDGVVPVVFCHGFPDLAYTWRDQLRGVADAGFRAIAADQRGPTGARPLLTTSPSTDSETSPAIWPTCWTCEIDRAVFVGHDWGGFVAWAMPVLFPERCAGVVGV